MVANADGSFLPTVLGAVRGRCLPALLHGRRLPLVCVRCLQSASSLSPDRVLARGRRRRPSVGPAAAAVADQVMSGEASPLPGSFGRLCQPAVDLKLVG